MPFQRKVFGVKANTLRNCNDWIIANKNSVINFSRFRYTNRSISGHDITAIFYAEQCGELNEYEKMSLGTDISSSQPYRISFWGGNQAPLEHFAVLKSNNISDSFLKTYVTDKYISIPTDPNFLDELDNFIMQEIPKYAPYGIDIEPMKFFFEKLQDACYERNTYLMITII